MSDKKHSAPRGGSVNEQNNSQATTNTGGQDNGNSAHQNSMGDKTQAVEPAVAIKTELQKVTEDLDKARNDVLYMKAEFDTYKRNAIKERSDLRKFGGESLIRDLLQVVDNFERALQVKVTPENIKTYSQGVEMTATELTNTLQKHGVTEIPSQNVPFDPAVHEALGAEVSKEVPPGHILRVHQKAFRLHDKVIRPAQVIVAKASEG